MVSENRADKQSGAGRHEPSGTLSRLVLRVANQLLGGTMDTTVGTKRTRDGQRDLSMPPRAPSEPVMDTAQTLEQIVARFEAVLRRMEELGAQQPPAETGGETSQELAVLKRALGGVFEQIGDAMGQLSVHVERLADEAARLALTERRLERRMDEFATSMPQGGSAKEREPEPERPQPVEEEPQFWPNEQAVDLVLAAVPGFQGLMNAQRALSDLAAAKGVSVVGYKNGEASLEVALRSPVTATQIVEELLESTGHRLLIEEARPEARRLRLRFVD